MFPRYQDYFSLIYQSDQQQNVETKFSVQQMAWTNFLDPKGTFQGETSLTEAC